MVKKRAKRTDISPIRPSSRKLPREKLFATSDAFFDELERRISILGQAAYMFEGLGIRLLGNHVAELQEEVLENPAYNAHRSYLGAVDIFSDKPTELQAGVNEGAARAAMAAELGTSQTPLQPLWRPMARELEADKNKKSDKLASLIAEKVEKGIALEDEMLDRIEKPDDVEKLAQKMPELKKILDQRKTRMAKEEK